MRLRVYVAGAYSAPNVMDVLGNIGRGIEACKTLLQAGYAPFCPWLDFLLVIQQGGNQKLTIEDMYEYTLAWLESADVLLILPGWENSKGTKAEIDRAIELGIPVCYSGAELRTKFPPNHRGRDSGQAGGEQTAS